MMCVSCQTEITERQFRLSLYHRNGSGQLDLPEGLYHYLCYHGEAIMIVLGLKGRP